MFVPSEHRSRPHVRVVIACIGMMAMTTVHAEDFVTTVAVGETTTTSQNLSAPASSDTHTLNNAGTVRGAASTTVVLLGSGAGRVVVNNNGRIQGRIDFSGLSGGVTLNNNTGGAGLGISIPGNATFQNWFSSGDDVVNNAMGATLTLGGPVWWGTGSDAIHNAGTITGAAIHNGLEVINNSGTLSMGGAPDLQILSNSGTMGLRGAIALETISNSGTLSIESNLDLRSLHTFDNSGTLIVTRGQLGGFEPYDGARIQTHTLETFSNDGLILMSEGTAFDHRSGRLLMPGADFVAGTSSRIFLDAVLDGGWQDNCASMGAFGSYQADCMSFSGGSTSGTTLVTVNGAPVLDGGAYAEMGVALIDVSGGTSDASHFVLDPNSPNYQDTDDMLFAGIRASDLFSYSLFYDESTQIHRLVGVPTAPFLTLGVLPAAVQSLWRVVNQAGSARLAELRQAKADAGGGFWFKYVDSDTERDATSNVTLFGQSASVAADYDQSSSGYLFGADFVGSEGESAYAFGVSVGDLDSEVKLTAGSANVDMTVLAINVYGSYRSGGFFLDMSGGGYSGDLEGDFFVGTQSALLEGKVNAFGARADTGWRMGLGNSFAIEPMVGLVFVRSGLNDIDRLPGSTLNAMKFDAANSFRGGVGARGSFESAFAGLKLGVSLTGRVWQEFDGEARSSMRTRVDSLPYTSEFDGTFTEVSAAIDLSALEGALSGYLEFGSQSGDDYDSTTGTLGVRYNW